MSKSIISLLTLCLLLTVQSPDAKADDELGMLAEGLLVAQEKWVEAQAELKRISMSRGTRRAKRIKLEQGNAKVTKLLYRLSLIRRDFRSKINKEIFAKGVDQDGSFEIDAITGTFACFGDQPNNTGFCTQENTNRSFTW